MKRLYDVVCLTAALMTIIDVSLRVVQWLVALY